MTGAEKGFLLLSAPLGDPERRVLTVAQLRVLGRRVRQMHRDDPARSLTAEDLRLLGYGREAVTQILSLLEQEELLEYYCVQGLRCDCACLSRISPGYPPVLRQRLGDDSPGSLWSRGDLSLLGLPKIALVGSRELAQPNRRFAEEVGFQAARQGYVLVSGNARGADRAAQETCLRAGGQVICVVADRLDSHSMHQSILYLSEDGFDLEFSARRAISRNRVIHALGQKTFVAQCGCGSGGTWSGTEKNLRSGWSAVYCFADHSPAQHMLVDMGAFAVKTEQLDCFAALEEPPRGFLE